MSSRVSSLHQEGWNPAFLRLLEKLYLFSSHKAALWAGYDLASGFSFLFFSPPWGLAWYPIPRARNSLSFLEDASSPKLVGVGWGKKILCLYACVFSRFSHVRLFATPWTVACQFPLSMGFSRQEYWSGLTFPSSGDLPNPGIKPRSPALQTDSLPSKPPRKASVSIGPLKCIS